MLWVQVAYFHVRVGIAVTQKNNMYLYVAISGRKNAFLATSCYIASTTQPTTIKARD